MSIENEVPVTTPAMSHKDAAAAIIDEVRGLKDRIPHFVIPESKSDRSPSGETSSAGRQTSRPRSNCSTASPTAA